MNLTQMEIDDYLRLIDNICYDNVIFAPSNLYLKQFLDKHLHVASQDVSPFVNGSYTGDVSALQLKSMDVEYVIIGHSERRKYYHEKEILGSKVSLCQKNKLTPILCVGENEDEKKKQCTLEVIRKQLDDIFKLKINPEIIIAYEPIWAIGTGIVPSNDEISRVVEYIKKYLYMNYNISVKVLYGGSVNDANVKELSLINNIDGYLVGGCSLNIEKFKKLIEYVNE